MLHARKDYNRRIQDSANIIPEDEPVFLLRGQDTFAPVILRIYAEFVKASADADENIIKNTLAQSKAMEKWQAENVCKTPDMNAADSVY